jgi:hypothetical protein
MVKFSYLTLTLIVVLIALIGTVHWIGRTLAAPLAILYTNPDGTPCKGPCFFGVRPGLTSYESAIQILHRHPFTRKFEPNFGGTMLRSKEMSLEIYLETYLWGSKTLVSRINLVNSAPSSSVASWGSYGQVTAALGMPGALPESEYTTEDKYDFIFRKACLKNNE